MNKYINETAVLMLTCKKYEQAWVPFFTLFKKYWPNCPYKLIMGTDQGDYEGVETISIGKDLGWTRNCIYILNKLPYNKLIMFFEDYLPCGVFDNERIQYLVKYSFDYNIACLRLQPCPGPSAPWKYEKSLGVLQKNDNYRFSWQTAVWDKTTLLSLLIPDETPWDTEINGTKRTKNCNKPFLSVKRGESPTPYIITAIVRGKWIKSALDLLKVENIDMSNITPIIKQEA